MNKERKLSERDRREREATRIADRVEVNYKIALRRLPHLQKPGNWPQKYFI